MAHDCWNYHGVGVYDWIGLAFPGIYLLYTHTHVPNNSLGRVMHQRHGITILYIYLSVKVNLGQN